MENQQIDFRRVPIFNSIRKYSPKSEKNSSALFHSEQYSYK